MNILMINGTMRKSSTYRIAKMFVERVTLSQDTVNELFLPKDMPEFCRGCGICITRDPKKCPDYLIYLKRVTRLIDEADLLVFATPTYVYHATGQVKALLDHYGYRWMVHRPEGSMFQKQAVCFATAAGAGMKSALKDITDSLKWWGVGRIYTYGVAIRSMEWNEVEKPIKDKIDQKVNELMAKIVHERERVTPSLYTRVLFYVMRYMHSRAFMQQLDTDYWRRMGWLGRKRPWIPERPAEEDAPADVAASSSVPAVSAALDEPGVQEASQDGKEEGAAAYGQMPDGGVQGEHMPQEYAQQPGQGEYGQEGYMQRPGQRGHAQQEYGEEYAQQPSQEEYGQEGYMQRPGPGEYGQEGYMQQPSQRGHAPQEYGEEYAQEEAWPEDMAAEKASGE